jgi:sulfatase maturation enzyme AslB (radical SAM superfamily)
MCVHCKTCGLALALEHTGDAYSRDHFVEPRYQLGNITVRARSLAGEIQHRTRLIHVTLLLPAAERRSAAI